MKKRLMAFLCLMLLCGCHASAPDETRTSQKKATGEKKAMYLEAEKDYELDLDGDGETEKIYYGIEEPHVYINDDIMLSCEEEIVVGGHMFYVELANGRRYLLLEYVADDDDVIMLQLLQYKERLEEVIDFEKLPGFINRGQVSLGIDFETDDLKVTVLGNTLKVFTCYTNELVGITWQVMSFMYKDGAFVLPTELQNLYYSSGYIYDLRDGIKPLYPGEENLEIEVYRKIDVYEKPGDIEPAFTLKKNARLSPLSFEVYGSKLYIRIKSGKKTGWIISQNDEEGHILGAWKGA